MSRLLLAAALMIVSIYHSIIPAAARYVGTNVADYTPAQQDWIKSLHAPDGVWCCTVADGDETSQRYTLDKAGGEHWEAQVLGSWYPVPPERVIKEPNLIGQPLVWWQTFSDGEGWKVEIRCFLPLLPGG